MSYVEYDGLGIRQLLKWCSLANLFGLEEIGLQNFTIISHFFFLQTFSLLMTLLLLYKSSTNVSIFLQCRSISEKEISFLILSGKYIAIALVDQNKLR